MVKPCPYCDITFDGTRGLYPHVFMAHKTEIIESLKTKYRDIKAPITPLSIAVPKYKKNWIVCLGCSNIWSKPLSYQTHISETNTCCTPSNQIAELQVLTGIKFSAKESDENVVIKALTAQVNRLVVKIDKQDVSLRAISMEFIKIKQFNEELRAYIYRLRPSVIEKHKDVPLEEAPPPPPLPLPVQLVVLPNQVEDEEEEEDDDDDDDYVLQPEPEPAPVKLKLKYRCTYAPDLCSEIGIDVDNGVWFDPCKACKKNVCSGCVSKRGSRNKLYWYCSPECFMSQKSPKIEPSPDSHHRTKKAY